MNKKRIVIIGGGSAGWITASILAKGLPSAEYDISLIESPDIPTIGVGEATIPPIIHLINYLDLDETDFIKKIEGTYKYGIHFENWSTLGHSYMHAFGEIGKNSVDSSFTQMWLAYKSSLNLPPLNHFSPCAVAAYSNKFSRPSLPSDAHPEKYYPLSKLFYAYQFDAGLLAKYLKNIALNLGINYISDNVIKVTTDTNIGIKSVTLTNNAVISADYFVDCSGTRGLLNKQALHCEYEGWDKYLPCDRAVVVQTKSLGDPFPYTKSIAMNAGWRWQIPLQTRTGNGYVYSSKHISDEEALNELSQALTDHEKINEYRVIKFQTGSLKTPWFKNSIALGLSGSFFEPLESTSIHMTHKYALELKNAFIYGTNMAEEATNFNAAFHKDSLSIRDFLIAHYCTTQRDDTSFWRDMQLLSRPQSLQSYLNEFEKTGEITLPQGSLFPYQSWLQILIGQQYLNKEITFTQNRPNQTDEEMKIFFTDIANSIQTEINSLPTHSDFIRNENK